MRWTVLFRLQFYWEMEMLWITNRSEMANVMMVDGVTWEYPQCDKLVAEIQFWSLAAPPSSQRGIKTAMSRRFFVLAWLALLQVSWPGDLAQIELWLVFPPGIHAFKFKYIAGRPRYSMVAWRWINIKHNSVYISCFCCRHRGWW